MKFRRPLIALILILALVLIGFISTLVPRLVLTPVGPDLAGACPASSFALATSSATYKGQTFTLVHLTHDTRGNCTSYGWPQPIVSHHLSLTVDLTSADFTQDPAINYEIAANESHITVSKHTVLSFEMMTPANCKNRYPLRISLPGTPSSTIALHRSLCTAQIHVTPETKG